MGIPYHDLLYLNDFWALDEVKRQPVCPAEIVEGKLEQLLFTMMILKMIISVKVRPRIGVIRCLCNLNKVSHNHLSQLKSPQTQLIL